MKTSLLYFLALTISTPSFAKEELIKACSTTIGIPGEAGKSETQINVIKKDGVIRAKISQKVDGQIAASNDEVTIEEFSVKADLKADLSDPSIDDLNQGEKLISHALSITTDPDLQNAFSAGFDLKKVRSVKIYTIGNSTKFGSTTIVEAKDESGKDLGSFLGGFLVSPCNDPKDVKVILKSAIENKSKINTTVSNKNSKISDKKRNTAKEAQPVEHGNSMSKSAKGVSK